ncbi:MAG TPA: hypothetical protein VGP93_20895 [Polyangiaceae bacterium]|nr:hypothetical protein [Polyangiaceae bacterium]
MPLIDAFSVALSGSPALLSATQQLTPRADFATGIEELVRRISWGGDRRSGTARIEFGAGSLRGAAVVVHASGGRRVSLELELPVGADAHGLERRLRERLELRGIEVTELTIR